MSNFDPEKTRELLKLAMQNDKSIRETIATDLNNILKENKDKQRKQYLEAFAHNLKTYRERNNLSKLQVANMCGLRAPNYYRYESGQHEPGALTALQLADILGTTVTKLFEIEPNNKEFTALSLQSFFEQQGLATSYDGMNTLTIIRNDNAIYYLSLNEAQELKTALEEMINPIIKKIITAQLTEKMESQIKPKPVIKLSKRTSESPDYEDRYPSRNPKK